MKHGCPIFLLQILRYTSHTPAHLILLLYIKKEAYLESSTNFKKYSLTDTHPWHRLINLILSLLSGKEPLQEYSFENVPSDGDFFWCSAIYPHLVPYLSRILEHVWSQLNLLLFINTHSTEYLLDLVHKHLGILIGSRPTVDWRIHPCEISQSSSHGAIMWVLPGSTLSSGLGCDNMCLSSDSVGHLNQCCSHFPIRQRNWVDRHLNSSSRGVRRSLVSLVAASLTLLPIFLLVFIFLHVHIKSKFDSRMTQNFKALHNTIKSRRREDS